VYSFLAGKLMRRAYREITSGHFGLVSLLAADDVTFICPGNSSFGGTHHGKAATLAWLKRFAALHPRIEVIDVTASGPPWNTRIAVRLNDAIGEDYTNQVLEMLWIRWGKLRRLEVFLDTARLTSWEARHPELAAV
jgi:ketosteroid isomerase-like protein